MGSRAAGAAIVTTTKIEPCCLFAASLMGLLDNFSDHNKLAERAEQLEMKQHRKQLIESYCQGQADLARLLAAEIRQLWAKEVA